MKKPLSDGLALRQPLPVLTQLHTAFDQLLSFFMLKMDGPEENAEESSSSAAAESNSSSGTEPGQDSNTTSSIGEEDSSDPDEGDPSP